ncbi:cell division protein ZapE [Camelimonas abortus]|uniref:Cell division protein ZapE n=1 Tax=Camelimonas abortus TaxID=1017184 RepID=A0ABV7LCZ1_9HYPH
MPSGHHAGPGSVRARYDALVAAGAIERDPAQLDLVARLDGLAARLRAPGAAGGGLLGRLFGRRQELAAAPRGLYVWGFVGRGKTMLMDLFYEEVAGVSKRRAHFHEFMADAHDRIFAFRQKVKEGRTRDVDPIPVVAAQLASEARLLCFDEFTVTDIADAMILGRLFRAMFERGVTVVATSNVEPGRLYENGLNRALFLPFIDLILERMDVVRLDSRTDFRLEKLAGARVFHHPADAAAAAALREAFHRLSGMAQGRHSSLPVKGRRVEIPEAGPGVARFGFADLCARAYGASDYRAVAENFHTVIIENIPVMGLENRNEAKRFITLVDTLYEYRVKLLASAEAPPAELYVATSGREAFEFDRTVSRLIEMQSEAYLALPHGRPAGEPAPEADEAAAE